ncbi:NAD(P)-dependent oxidoreductase [Patescibacteria group bacterium]|jgi:nucleoside-diphosphate-sugar epimerase|nr:NAD(P)-dependent oxidoreductase [Patescibacteria group bacterium]
MKILVTGAQGNIGWYIVESLKRFHPEAEIIGTTRQDVDLIDNQATREYLKRIKPEYVIHTAAKTYNAEIYKKQPYDVFTEDVAMIMNVIDGCIDAGTKKIVYLSSATVYEGVKDVPFREEQTNDSAPPSSPTGLAKLAGERGLAWAAQQHGIDFTIWRLFNAVSPREPHDKPGAHVYVDFYRQLFVEKVPELPIFGNGNQERCFTWVEDITDAVASYLMDEKTSKQTINLGGNEPSTLLQLRELFLAIGKEKGLLAPEYDPPVKTGGQFFGVEAQRRVPSLEKAETLLGWKPSTGFRECFEKFVAAKQA